MLKCVWRKVIEKDLEKIAKEEANTTLLNGEKTTNKANVCLDCNGYNMVCPSYVAIKHYKYSGL
jgi:hypothetical protein